MRRHRCRRAWALPRVPLAVVAGAALLAACGEGGEDLSTAESRDEASMAVHLDEPYGEADIEELSSVADLVVVGEVRDVVEEDVSIDDSPNTRYDVYTVAVEEELTGRADRSEIEVILLSGIGTVDVEDMRGTLEHRAIPAVGGRGIWFLDEVDPMFDRDGYVLTSSQSVLVDAGEGDVRGADPESPLGRDIRDLVGFDEVIGTCQAG